MTTMPSPQSREAIPIETAQTPLVRQYLDILRRRIWIIATLAILITCLQAVRTYRAPNIYSAETKILVERQSPKVAFADPGASDFATWDPDFYSTQAQLVRSQPVLEIAAAFPEIARTLGQDTSQESPPVSDRIKEVILAALGAPPTRVVHPAERLASYLTTRPVAGSHFLLITATATDPRTPAIIANGVAQAFEIYMRRTRTDKLGDAFSYLKEEKEREEQKYLLAEKELMAFREEAKGIDLRDSESASPAIDKLSALNGKLTELQLRRAELKSQIVVIREIIRNKAMDEATRQSRLLAVPIIKEDEAVAVARARVVEAQAALKTLAETYGASHPQILKATETVAAATAEFDDALQRTVLLHANRLQGLQSEEADISAQYEKQKDVALSTARETFKMARLEMEVDRHRQLFDALVKRMLEIEMSSGFDVTNVNIIEEATPSRAPIGPKRTRAIITALLMGLALGLGLAIVVETMDDTVKTPEDLRQHVGLPLLGFIPQIRPPAPGQARKRSDTLFAVDEPISSIAEAFRQVRTSLFYSLSTSGSKVVAATSCHPSEGKTTTISNMAAVIAQSGRRVLLIDGDFHRPHVHRIFGVEGSLGLADVLAGTVPWSEVIVSPHRNDRPLENLDIIVAGHSTPASSELLSSEAMRLFIEQARQSYDWVLVDTPPLLFVSDASVLSALCDGIILVVKSGMNNRSLLVKTREHLEQIKVKILGAILNQMVVSRFGRNYSYYYYHGYSRYSQDYHNTYYGPDREEAQTAKHGTGTQGATVSVKEGATAVATPLPLPLAARPSPPSQMDSEGGVAPRKPTTTATLPPAHRVPPTISPPSPQPVTPAPDASAEELGSVRDSLDELEHQQTEILEKLQAMLNHRPADIPPRKDPGQSA